MNYFPLNKTFSVEQQIFINNSLPELHSHEEPHPHSLSPLENPSQTLQDNPEPAVPE